MEKSNRFVAEKRVNIDQKDLEEAIKHLRSNGHTNKSISQAIGSKIDSYLYENYNMSEDSFQKLLDLYGKKIKHRVEEVNHGSEYRNEIPSIEKDETLAELIGVILGDGHIQEYISNNERHVGSYFIEITLHEEEKELIDRVRTLLESKTGKKFRKYEKEGKAIRLVVYSKDLVQKLKNLGLETGDKTKNQVKVPEWIKKDKNYSKKCLRGLIDTDGAIYQDKRKNQSYTRIQFKNYSKPLLDDFVEMCSTINIDVVSGGKHQKQVSRRNIEEFIQKIEPLKGKNIEYT